MVPTTSAPKEMTREQAQKVLRTWFRVLIVLLVLGLPTSLFVRAGRQLQLNRSLFEAIRRNDANTVKFLLDAGAYANAQEPEHDSRSQPQKIFDEMRGIPGPSGPSALQVSLTDETDYPVARPENVEIARALLEHRADPNVTNAFQETPLMLAAKQQKAGTVQLLLKHGADVHAKGPFGAALESAITADNVACVLMLLDAGADVNAKGLLQVTPLEKAVAVDDIPIIKLLIKRGADVNAVDQSGTSILEGARRLPYSHAVALLKAAGAH